MKKECNCICKIILLSGFLGISKSTQGAHSYDDYKLRDFLLTRKDS